MTTMSTQNRISLTLSARMRKALEVCAAFDGSTPASYAATLLSVALMQEIEKSPALHARWIEMERDALQTGSWELLSLPVLDCLEETSARTPTKPIKGWVLSGNNPASYASGIDTEITYNGRKSAYLKSKGITDAGFATLMQIIKADKYRGRRVRFSAVVKSEDVENWAGLWMRIDGKSQEVLGFDNMQNRPIKGTTDWHLYEVVLDVAQESTAIAFGILLEGQGQVWMSDTHLEEVGNDIPTTGAEMYSDTPDNLDFSN